MGNDQVKPEHRQNYQEEELKISHQRFHNLKYHGDKDFLQITLDVPEEKQLKTWEKDVKSSVQGFQSNEILLLPVEHEYQARGWCGTTGSIKIFYENFPYIFSEELQNRINLSKYFQQEQLWYLLYSLISSAKDFHKLSKKIGDIRPENIFINEEGQIKIANLYSWPYEKTNFQKTAFQKQLTYISPEEMKLIQEGNHENTTDIYRSQSFSIGLTLLETGLLCNVKEIYSVQNNTILVKKLEQKLNRWWNLKWGGQNSEVKSYSPLLKSMIASLCQVSPSNRQTGIHLEQLLSPFHNEIMNLKEFDKNSIQFNIAQRPMGQSSPQQLISHKISKAYQSTPSGSAVMVQSHHVPHPQPVIYGNDSAQSQYRVIQVPSYIQNQPVVRQQYHVPLEQQERIGNVGFSRNEHVIYEHNVNGNSGNNHTQHQHKEYFTKYTASKPHQHENRNFYSGGGQPIEHQFQLPAIPTYTYRQTSPAIPANNIIANSSLNTINISNQHFGQTNVQIPTTSSYPYYQVPANQTYIPSVKPQQYSVSNDFLRKIDEQLQKSRKNFPSL